MSSQEPGWIAVVGWTELTHSDTKRSAGAFAWHRAYTRLMRDDAYMELTEHRALIYHRLLLEYASTAARLRAETRSLSRRLGLRVTSADLESLSHAGFIKVCASRAQAVGWHDASVHATRDREREESLKGVLLDSYVREEQQTVNKTDNGTRLDKVLPATESHVTALSAERRRQS